MHHPNMKCVFCRIVFSIFFKDLMNTRTMNPSEPTAQRGSMISVPCGHG